MSVARRSASDIRESKRGVKEEIPLDYFFLEIAVGFALTYDGWVECEGWCAMHVSRSTSPYALVPDRIIMSRMSFIAHLTPSVKRSESVAGDEYLLLMWKKIVFSPAMMYDTP